MTMLNTYLYQNDGSVVAGNEAQIDQWQGQSDAVIWIDVQYSESNVDSLQQMLMQLGCHELALIDTFRKRHPPKVEAFADNLFILYRGIINVENNLNYEHQQIGFFISERMLITVHPQLSMGINQVLKQQLKNPRFFTPMAIALEVIHQSAGIYLESTLNFEDQLSAIEDELRTVSSESALIQLSNYKSELIKLKRIFNYHNVMFSEVQRLTEDDSPFDLVAYQHKINDVAERLERLHSLSQMHYEICGDMIDSYISISSHKLNHTMRILTVVTAIFVPLTFLAGIYGMNFENIPELKYSYGYPVLLVVMMFIAIVLGIVFKKKNWF